MNPLVRDRDIDFLLDDVLDVTSLLRLPYFADHDRETVALFLASARRLAREVLFPAYKPMDEAPPRFENGRVFVHPRMQQIYPQLIELGYAAATRPAAVGGQQIPLLVTALAGAYLVAANPVAGLVGLTTGAAHLLEAYASDELRRIYMAPLYAGQWTGTMALTEPQAGSSLADVATRATPAPDGSFRIVGAKTFISGGDHDLTANIVHMTLARIDGAPAGIKGVSLFCVPKRRVAKDGALVDNDVSVTGMIHKIGWRGLPSLSLGFGERGDCHGFLVGEPNRGISYMFQMMNEARIMVGMNGVGSASVAFHEARAYAETRTQGRPIMAKDPTTKQIPIVEHADVRRMLLRQKAIVEGGLALLARTAMFSDLAEHAESEAARARSKLLLDLLTPITKSFPAERGYEANTLALQVHGGYGYSSEYLVESWLRDQKLNSLHEGTTGIQGMDLLGRKVIAGGGTALQAFAEEVGASVAAANEAGVDARLSAAVARALDAVVALTMELGAKGLSGDVEGMMLHSSDYLDLFSSLTIAWQHLTLATAAVRRKATTPDDAAFVRGKILSAEHWILTEMPRVEHLVALCRAGEDSYARIRPNEL